MTIGIIEASTEIAERLIELIRESVVEPFFLHARNCEEAQDLFQEKAPDALLMDLKYPGLYCLEMLKNLKIKNKNTTVILLYTHLDEMIFKKLTEEGADYLLDKYTEFEKIPVIINQKKKLSAPQNKAH